MRAAADSPGGADFAHHRRTVEPDDIIDALADGTAVVLVGPVGAGKTVMLSRVVQGLAQRDIPAEVIRGIVTMRGTPLMSACELPRAGTVLIVDDAQDLDEETAAFLIDAICRRGVAICFAVEVPSVVRGASCRVARALLDLGARGAARRIDLAPLTETEAASYLRRPDLDGLDDVTRDAIVWLANGSHALLLEFAESASAAVRSGRDPIVAIRETPEWTRLADAVRTHLASLDDGHLSTLVVVHRFPGLASSHAARIRPAREVDALRAVGYLHRDDSDARALWANPVLGDAAARRLGAERVEALVRTAASLMLDAGGRWWSPSIAAAVADLLLRGDDLAVPASDELRRRVLWDAARQSNDQGRHALAEAYATLGIADAAEDVGLRLEHAHALLSAGEPATEQLASGGIFDEEERTRALLLNASWVARGYASSAQALRECLERGPAAQDDPRLSFAAIDALGWSLEWGRARDGALRAAAKTTGYWRVAAWLTEAYARGQLGDADGARRLLARVEESVCASGVPGLGTAERLWVLIVTLETHLVLGEDAPAVHERIARERGRAVREGDGRVLGIAGLASALSAAVRGDSDEALQSLGAARERFPPLRRDLAAAGVKLWIAQFLAKYGRVREAREITDRVQSIWSEGPLVLRHGCAAAQSMIDALDQRYDEAARAAREALALTSAREAPMLRARDLYRGIALEVVGEDTALEIERLVVDTRTPLKKALSEPPPRVSRGHRVAEVRAAFARTLITRTPSAPLGSTPGSSAAASPFDPDLLTRREVEIAGLIAAGLSNREIAEQLFLSVRTVESHIYQARGKVGASTRRELGQRVGSSRPPR